MKYVSSAVRHPERILPFLKTRLKNGTKSADHWIARKAQSIPKQKPRLHRFTNQDQFLLIILDAARFDIFKEQYNGHLKGDLSCVWAAGHWTAEYVSRTWDGSHEMTYLNTTPVISDRRFEIRGSDYRPSQHINELVQAWKTHWDSDLDTVRAEALTQLALEYYKSGTRRLVVHYMQPHVPYIGPDTEQLADSKAPSFQADNPNTERIFTNRSRQTNWLIEQVESGAITDSDLRDAYSDNLQYVLRSVWELISRVDVPVVVTADHGEHLGESGRYLHDTDSRLIRKVPWLEIDEDITGTAIDQQLPYSGVEQPESTSNRTVEEQLESLGYKT